MFGDISPTVRNLLGRQNNRWLEDQVIGSRHTAASSSDLSNSPGFILEASSWSTNASAPTQTFLRQRSMAIPGAPARARWQVDSSLNGIDYTTILTADSGDTIAPTNPLLTLSGREIITTSASNSTPGTVDHLVLNNTGTNTHLGFTFSGSYRTAISTNSNGTVDFRTAGSGPLFQFQIGSSIGSTLLIAQIYGGGIYNYYGSYNGGQVTAGQADTSTQTSLSTYGSFAVKGTLVTSSTYTIAQTETVVYVDPSNANVCAGTPPACSTYVAEGTCNARSAVGCSWFAGTSCGIYSGTDSGTCTGQAGCTWQELSCSGANNTDQTTCESQDDSYGGNCSWDTSTCPSYSSDQTSCEATTGCTWSSEPCSNFDGQSQGTCESNSGCTWTGGDCHAFDGTDQSTCESGHTGCSWDNDNSLCNGTYDEASVCSGVYNTACTGNLCNGNYATGDCLGSFGALCQGTATCSLVGSQTPCNAEPGCAWTTGITLTLPTTANSSRGTTGRLYMIQHVGQTVGTVIIQGQSGQPIFQYNSVNLFKPADRVILHNQNITFPCSAITTQVSCQAQSGCTWNPAIICSNYGDETACNEAGGGCSWNGSACTGPGTSASCSGSYSNGSHWYVHNIDRGYSYTEKTANYTLTIIDDVVAVTANNVTLTLPSAVNVNGKEYTLKNLGTGVVTMNTTSSQTIDGNASGVLTLNQYDSLTVRSNGTNWIIV